MLRTLAFWSGSPIVTMISFTTSVDNTVIYYDEHEDGFEPDITNPTQSTTKIWGDGDASNGCAPDVDPCTDAADVINAGRAIVIENYIACAPRDVSQIFYDGGDRVMSNFPIAVTRAAYPLSPGSVLAGAVEVLDTSYWAESYVSPVGPGIWKDEGNNAQDPFGYCAIVIMAGEDNTVVTYPNGTTITLDMGESITVKTIINDEVTASKPVQATLLTGDGTNYYETRWFALLPQTSFAKDYLAPVGDSYGQTRVYAYNPDSSSIDVSFEYTGSDGSKVTKTMAVPGGSGKTTDIIPTDSAMRVTGTSTFLALSITDTKGWGLVWDWGFPVMPTSGTLFFV
jgi:hypothetical protein